MNEACNTPTETEVNHIYLNCMTPTFTFERFFFHFFATSPFTSVETVAKIYAKFDNMYLNNKGSN